MAKQKKEVAEPATTIDQISILEGFDFGFTPEQKQKIREGIETFYDQQQEIKRWNKMNRCAVCGKTLTADERQKAQPNHFHLCCDEHRHLADQFRIDGHEEHRATA